MCVSHSVVSDSFVTTWTVAHQAPLSMGFCRQEHWSGLLCPPPGALPDPGMEPTSPMSPALGVMLFTCPLEAVRLSERMVFIPVIVTGKVNGLSSQVLYVGRWKSGMSGGTKIRPFPSILWFAVTILSFLPLPFLASQRKVK